MFLLVAFGPGQRQVDHGIGSFVLDIRGGFGGRTGAGCPGLGTTRYQGEDQDNQEI